MPRTADSLQKKLPCLATGAGRQYPDQWDWPHILLMQVSLLAFTRQITMHAITTSTGEQRSMLVFKTWAELTLKPLCLTLYIDFPA